MSARFRSCPFPFLLVLASLLAAGSAAAQPTADYRRWILAEGAANVFFDEDIVIANPGTSDAAVTVTLMPEVFAGEADPPEPVTIPITVPRVSRYTFRVNDYLIEEGPPEDDRVRPGAVSAIVESNVPIVVERTMTWPGSPRRGTHATQGVLAPADTWYLAEGVKGFFDTFILVTNTNETQPATVSVEFLQESGAPVTDTFTIPARGRRTIYVNQDDRPSTPAPDQRITTAFSTVVRQTDGGGRADLVVERAMYWNEFEGGHGSAGVNAPSNTWLFAEGVTGGVPEFRWSTFLLLANPSDDPTDVTLRFFKQDGTTATLTLSGTTASDPLLRRLEPRSRRTLDLASLVFPSGDRELESTSFGIRVESVEPILAERAVYWTTGGILFVDGHNTTGLTEEAYAWAFAEGREGRLADSGLLSHDTFFLLSNSSAQPIGILATFLREDGTGLRHRFTLNASTRLTLNTTQFPELSNQRFSAFFQAVDANGAPITTQTFVAERAVYWTSPSPYFAGHAATGTPWTGTVGTPAVIPGPMVASVAPSNGPLAGGTEILVRGTNFAETSTVRVGGRAATGVVVVDSTTLFATVPAATSPGAVPVCVQTPDLPTTPCLDGAFTYNEPPPTDPTTRVPDSLAIGDSITYGTSCRPDPNLGYACDLRVVPTYPNRLQSLLSATYPRQPITVTGSGRPGECVSTSGCGGWSSSGAGRLPGELQPAHDLVIILEGVNDLNNGRSPQAIQNALRSMVAAARGAGKQVILCSLTPVLPDIFGVYKAEPGDVAAVNALIDALAIELNLPRVDMVAAFGSNPGQFLSVDGLHPNAAGYQRMAEAIRNKIVEVFQTP